MSSMTGRRDPVHDDHGLSLIEVLFVLLLASLLAATTVPGAQALIDGGQARQAAGFVAARLRAARQHAVFQTAAEGLVFDWVGDRWTFRVCRDGNGNGLRRRELSAGPDRCVEGPYAIDDLFPNVQVAVDGSLRGPGGEPGNVDPVRFGRSDIASFSPAGTASAGSLYLRSALGVQYAVRVAGINGRTRVLRYDTATGRWREI
jgi:prepilin-type N-terminal cleavage/methylation domain-containing protein